MKPNQQTGMLSVFRPPLCFELAGKQFFMEFDDGYDRIANFKDRKTLCFGVEGEEKAGLCSGTENCWAVNAKAPEADQKATLDFMYWLVTSEAGTKMMAEQFGAIPYKHAAASENVFLQNANEYLAAGCYNVDWAFNYTPNVDEWRAGVVAAMNQYDAGTGSWDDVVTAFVQGWKNQYEAIHQE